MLSEKISNITMKLVKLRRKNIIKKTNKGINYIIGHFKNLTASEYNFW